MNYLLVFIDPVDGKLSPLSMLTCCKKLFKSTLNIFKRIPSIYAETENKIHSFIIYHVAFQRQRMSFYQILRKQSFKNLAFNSMLDLDRMDRRIIFNLGNFSSPQRLVIILSVFYQLLVTVLLSCRSYCKVLLLPCTAERFWRIKLFSKQHYG